MHIKIFSIAFLVLISFGGLAQKLKYKEIYPYLKSKNYDQAIPKLKQFLSIDNNNQEASPNLEMGVWLYERFMELEEGSDQLNEVGDSAILYLQQAKKLIDEKEVKKNEKYYLDFKRRDLRSGKFAVKVSDVHLDIENKIGAIEKKKN